MGGNYSTETRRSEEIARNFTPAELNALVQSTHYSAEELMLLRIQFLTDVPEGAVTMQLFRNAALACGINNPTVVAMLFRAFDSNRDGLISFFEYARSMSVMTRGTSQEKIAFAFDMYDVDHLGELRAETVLALLQNIDAGLLGPLSRSQIGDSAKRMPSTPQTSGGVVAPRDIILEMFSKSSTLSREDFRAYALSNPAVVRGLALH